jgi:hypothetical protein
MGTEETSRLGVGCSVWLGLPMYRVMNSYSNLPHRARLEAPAHKRTERRVIEDNVSCAFNHSSSRDIAGLTVDLKEGNATAREMLRTSFERIVLVAAQRWRQL